ncbi:MAG: DUF1836 domain-containing protein [Eubacteriales bacterium]|nr:DUF1836 domain-containing protein [Eubacteriales bacterium]
MSDSHEQIIRRLITQMSDIQYIPLAQMPNIPLYMDQLTTFMDERLSGEKLSADDPILTKTMINNYTKNKLLPPPDKKKYSLEHLLLLNFIYYYKSFLSIGEIKTILAPFSQGGDTEILAGLYDEMTKYAALHSAEYAADVEALYEMVLDEGDGNGSYQDTFRFISLLSAEVYLKKQLLERLVQHLEKDEAAPAKPTKPPKKSKTVK